MATFIVIICKSGIYRSLGVVCHLYVLYNILYNLIQLREQLTIIHISEILLMSPIILLAPRPET